MAFALGVRGLHRVQGLRVPRTLSDFWPSGGPVWDGLARTSAGRSLLVEAKANVPELDNSPAAASGRSLTTIEEALNETKTLLGVRSETGWTRCFYQYANRLAHLYFLKELNGIEDALIFVYFTGDTTISGVNPVSREDWEATMWLATNRHGVRLSSPWGRENVVDGSVCYSGLVNTN